MSALNFKAIAMGVLIDLGASLAFGVVLGILSGMTYASTHGNMEGFEEHLAASVPLLVVSLIFGLIFVAIGGYFAGKIAGENHKANALAVGVAGIVISLLFVSSYPAWFNIASFVLIIPFAYLGGLLSIPGSRKDAA